jgi:hypothetical protein
MFLLPQKWLSFVQLSLCPDSLVSPSHMGEPVLYCGSEYFGFCRIQVFWVGRTHQARNSPNITHVAKMPAGQKTWHMPTTNSDLHSGFKKQTQNLEDPVLTWDFEKAHHKNKKGWWSGSRCKPWAQIPVPQKKKKKKTRTAVLSPMKMSEEKQVFFLFSKCETSLAKHPRLDSNSNPPTSGSPVLVLQTCCSTPCCLFTCFLLQNEQSHCLSINCVR